MTAVCLHHYGFEDPEDNFVVMEALKSDPEALATKTQWDPLDVYVKDIN